MRRLVLHLAATVAVGIMPAAPCARVPGARRSRPSAETVPVRAEGDPADLQRRRRAALFRHRARHRRRPEIAIGPAPLDPGDDKQLVLAVPPLGPGRYRVIWHVVSVDTHRTEGEYTFTVGP